MDFKAKKAIYLQIADHVCEQILRSIWLPDRKIPSIRELAIDLAVNPNTVMRTYAYLEEKSIINKKRGIGYFVALDANKKITELKKEQFYHDELPIFFKTIELLGISFPELQKLYEETKNESET